jgi:hypothetical protein
MYRPSPLNAFTWYHIDPLLGIIDTAAQVRRADPPSGMVTDTFPLRDYQGALDKMNR